MKLLFDLLPIVAFFVVFKIAGVLAATATAIGVTIAQVIYSKVKHGKVDKMLLVSCGLIVVFGGATLIFQDDTFIKWKPTILYLVFAAVFAGSHFIGEKTVVERLLGKVLVLPQSVWVKLSVAWTIFFVALAAANLIVAYNFETDVWVNYKLFGALGLKIVFLMAQGLFLHRYVKTHPAEGADGAGGDKPAAGAEPPATQ